MYGEAAVHVSTVQPWVNWVNKAETEGAQLHDKLDGMRKGVILVKSAFFVEILRSVISYLQVCPTRMLRIVSPTWQCWAMQVCAPLRPSLGLDREHFHTLLQSWLHTITFSPVCYFERQPVKTLVYKWPGTVECHASVAAEEGKQLLPGGSTCTLKVKEGNSTERQICCQQCCEILWNFHVCDLWRAWYTKKETLISD